MITTGNITNADLERLFLDQLPLILDSFRDGSLVELGSDHATRRRR